MDEYDKKFAEMQKYIPFLEAMIERLQNVKDKSREVQLQKMQSLHGILSNSKRKLKIETLQRCEDVLQKLHNRVEKFQGNTPGLHFPHKKNDASSTQSSNMAEEIKSQYTEDTKSQYTEDAKFQHIEDVMEDREIHETPASPSPPVSPDSGSQVEPIIIPTERSIDFDDKSDSKPASPDPIETLPTKAPIIIPTERTSNDLTLSPQLGLCKNTDDVSFTEWEMLEENENQISRNKNWQTIITSNHDAISVVKMVGNNLPQKMNDGRVISMPISSSRQISSAGGSRRLSSILEKNRLTEQVSSDSRSESPVNVSDTRLKSPDSEILFSKICKNSSLKSKDSISKPTSKPSAPLLLSPPPVFTEPPLSMEDLAELLNEEDDNKMEKKNDRLRDDAGKFKKEKHELNTLSGNNKDVKASKSFLLTQEDIDSESERRWEEIDKHIVKLTSRKCLPSGSSSTSMTKVDALKSNEIKGPSQNNLSHTSSSFTTSTLIDNRNLSSSPGSKTEPRFADNYERHSRQSRENQNHDKDKINIHNMHCRSDDDISNQIPMHHGNSIKPDDRNAILYQRRQNNIGPELVSSRIDTEFRMEGSEYFNRQIPNQGHWPSMHLSVNTNDFCNNQWPPSSNFSGVSNSPAQTYQHAIGISHQEMWNIGSNRESIHIDPHQMNESQMRANQFSSNMNTGIRPLMSPNTRPQDLNHIPRPDDMPNIDVANVSTIQPLISPTRFSVGPQYRNFQGENRSYDPSFDRGMEYSHQRQPWDSPVNRSNDVSYRTETELPCGMIGPAEGPPGPSYPRPSTPCPWNRDRDRSIGRGRNTYYNERNRGESRNFSRDTRRPEWSRDNHNDWDCNRFSRDARNISDRDPRVRIDHNIINQSSGQSRDNSTLARDPRLAKDKHFSITKGKDGNYNERDPRKRSAAPSFIASTFRKTKEKPKSPSKPTDSYKRIENVENNNKQMQEKTAKDKMQSPLESLYGVIDTKAKSAQGYSLQNFKIPKIKRNEPSESPTSSHVSEEIKECLLEKQDDKIIKKDKEDTTAEVSSSSDGKISLENWNENNVIDKKEELKEDNISKESIEDKSDMNIAESDSITITSSKLSGNIEKLKKEEVESEGSKSKDEVTQEWIEALIRKSFEFGEGKKFVEQAKFMQKLGEVLQAKKLKKIKKIIESESESSSSDKDDTSETKKVQIRKKRRVIVSDSSDEESLAERLGILNTPNKEIQNINEQKQEKNKNNKKISLEIKSSDLLEKELDGKDSTTQKEIISEIQSIVEEKESNSETSIEKKESISNIQEISKEIKENIKEDLIEDKEIINKIPKVKAKRRNSLEMLQEDIREMFISDGVVAATGHRLCRTQKENQNNAGASTSNQNISNQNISTVKKDESNKRDLEIDLDVEDTSGASLKQKKFIKSRVSEESNKSKVKLKKEVQRITRQRSKQYNHSSDSEEDQPLALRTELVQNANQIVNNDSEVLRRSKRIINKEVIKEPRVVVEKTDISKLECSKMMFDSSSDESFGIDVSELAAAVDISLHPDKQLESEATESTEKKKFNQISFRKSTRKKGTELMNESKDDIQFTDEESITSDISMSSSIISGKKTDNNTTRIEINSNEKLLSNILVGLVSVKNEVDKDSSVADKGSEIDKDSSIADKGSDADVDDDINDQVPTETSTKKCSIKKKKKKWQMGILSKKRRKKTLITSSPKGDCEMDTSIKMDNISVSENTINKEINSSNNQTNQTFEDNIKDTSICQENSKDQKTELLLTSDFIEKKKSLSKIDLTEESEVKEEKVIEKPLINITKNMVKSKNEEEKSFSDLDIKKLIDYVWTGQERYKCLLCFFMGKNIVHHYKLSHPGKEILISRLKVSDALLAIQDANDNNIENISRELLTEEVCKFRCRFCSLFIEGAVKVAMEAFYEHCTTHTGEYRFRCNSCPYQAVAKSSMRTHYYKVCRKFKDTFAEAITEDEIPNENRIYGYLCSYCNYVQLKKSNVEEHVNLWHKNDLSVKIIKINMSLESVEEEPKVKLETIQANSVKAEGINNMINNVATSVEQNDDDVTEIRIIKNNKTSENEINKVKDILEVKSQDNCSELQATNDEKKCPQAEIDSSLPSGNLSVFVCPPELEKKEVEIQLERKRKMQEIIQNIGIRLQKDASKKGLSIIDKLKDKMKTNIANNEIDSNIISNNINNINSPNKSPINSTISLSKNNDANLPQNSEVSSIIDTENKLSSEETSNDVKSNDCTQTQLSTVDCDSKTEKDPTNSKIKDPLITLDQKKDGESDAEISDNENTKDTAPIYDSDSSSEQSDSELPTDVNVILKETSNINASSKDPMLTTIQRLAAQLQAAKPLEKCKEENCSKTDCSKPKESKRTSPSSSIPKPPDVVPISSIKKFIGKKENRFHEISHELHDESNPPKNFIRLRRLSGDMLSVPIQSFDFQDVSLSKNNVNQPTPDKMDSILKSDMDEECSFLKIENVVSLAPRADNDGAESPIVHDIRKAVETSPIKNKGVSLLKKSNSPLILKRLNTVTITQPLTKNIQTVVQSTPETVKLIPVKSISPSPVSVTTTQLTTNFIPIAPKSKIIQVDNKLSFPISTNKNSIMTPMSTRTVNVAGSPQSSNLNYKILKVVRTPTILKPKEPVPPPTAIKLKSADAYNTMLKATKLIHLYKCMACRFTTDILAQYHQHYLQHANEAEKKKLSPPFDYQKCAYCHMILEDWNQMKIHIDEKHAHCRYQCIYCFYRAVVPSYVQIHQAVAHRGHHGILLGKLMKEIPLKEEFNRHENVFPYVCQHDCGKFFFVPESFMAHLKNKHGANLSTYKCHLCRVTFMKIDQLLAHYKIHGFYKYQCLYCLHGSDYFTEMHSHLSTFHCDRLPQVLERSLPPQPVRNKDVIDQLIIRTLDDTFKITGEIIDVENDGKDNKDVINVVSTSPSHKILCSQLSKDVIMLDKDENNILNKSTSSIFGISNNSINFSSNLLQNEKPKNEGLNDSAINKMFGNLINDSDVSVTSISKRESTDKNLLNKSKKKSALSDRNSVEPIERNEGTFDCNDEFININLLDNPDFLKKINTRSTNISIIDNLTINKNKMEDSDIEIVDIDDTEIPAKNIKSELNKKDSIDTKSKNEDTKSKEKVKVNPENNIKEQSRSDVKDINTNENSNNIVKADKPLTLDDIKDTGFSGMKLYKCGYETCDYGAQTAAQLRIHVKECSLGNENKNLTCAHCKKRFLKIGFLLEHLKSHGLKRFGCSLCKMRCTVGYQAMAHMKMKHKYTYSKLVPADPKNPSVDGLFIVQPIRQSGERKGKKRKTSTKSTEKDIEKITTDIEKFTFGPDEIESLPLQAIYNREVQCAMCPYTTKVRTNIIRHLRLHAKDESVPESGPVNPVPCLDKKERMFDKMVNLASSSHQNGRMGGKPKESNKNNDEEFIPKFIPEHKRYVCGVAECNYLTVDEAMLRCHLKALHSEELYFRCPHCPQLPPGQEGLNIAIDKMGVHLKMHDTRLYKCSHCNHHHYHRHVVERHLSDKHPEKRPFVKVIRELENTENSQQSIQEEIEEEIPDPDGNHWKCNICDYKCVYKADMVNHTSNTHDEKCQYKCNSCSFKTGGKIMFEQHVTSKHSSDSNVDYILIYQRIKGINKKNTDNIEQSGQEEPFDTTPLWRRDMPRIRHIRGILLEEEDEISTESSLKIGKRKSDAELSSTKPAKIKPGKSGSLDGTKQTKEKSKRSLSCDKVSTEMENASNISNTVDKSKETKSKSIEDNDINECDIGRFGPYGKADGNMYVCTLCTQFKTKYKHDMRDHLYRELNYARWHCKECGYLSVNRNALLKHFTKHHNGERPNHEPLSPDDDIEEWVGTLLKRQTLMIKGLLTKQNVNNVENSVITNTIGNDSKTCFTKVTQSTVTKTLKSTNVTDKSFNKQDNKKEITQINLEVQNECNKDSSIDIKKDSISVKEKTVKTMDVEKAGPEEEQEKPFTCKHCKMTFFRWRGFKLHIQLTHLKRLGFICPYCDRSTNSEGLMRQHIRSKHPGCLEKIVENPAAGEPELPEEFWQQEYGIVFPKRYRKRKRKISGEEVVEKSDNQCQIEPQEKCNICNFTAMNMTGLKIHMRIHATKNTLKCSYCTFTAATNSEVWEHWEINHPFSPFKVEDISPSESSGESTEIELNKKVINDDYNNDIEEEISDIREEDSIYYCFYCSFRSKSLNTVQNHWNMMHNDSLQNDSTKMKSNYPFRYKEMRVSSEKSLIKAQCSKTQTESSYELYLQQSHNNDVQEIEASGLKQEGWICQWCNELCDSEVKMKTHHSMFHSHLPLNFKKQEKAKISRGYVCPECSFTTTFINVMKNHVSKHINLFKCKYCDKTFSCPSEVSTHNTEEHPDMELKIESIQNYETLLEKVMVKVKWQKSGQSADKNETSIESPPKNHAVAKKSTTKSAFRSNIIPYRIKAVARKSTNPHSRYLANHKIHNKEQEMKNKQFSYYGVPRSPINLAKLNTYMVVGGHRMKVNCTTLAQLINIDPKIILKDLKNDIKNIATFKKLK